MASSHDPFRTQTPQPPPQPAPQPHPARRNALPLPEVARAQKQAQTNGLVAGMAAGVGGALILRPLLRLSPNRTLGLAFVLGSTTGFVVAGRTLSAELSALRDSEVRLGRAPDPAPAAGAPEQEMLAWDMKAGTQQEHEAGVGGLWQYKDPAATTRGDH